MNNSISDVNIKLQFDYDNFYELVQYAIADSITIDDKKISKDLPAIDQLETELLEKEYEINYLKKQLENKEKFNENNG
jgi:predicted RNase H-like nuclease (RuvC/YqgF family)